MVWHIESYSTSLNKGSFIESFLKFPYELYPQLKKVPYEVEKSYFALHPFKHDFFIFSFENKIILRFMLCQTPHQGLSFFGLFDVDLKAACTKDALELFKEKCSAWLVENACQKILGPINFSTWLPYRFLSHVDGGPSFSFEPDRPLDYCYLLKEIGFKTNQLFTSKGFSDITPFLNDIEATYNNLCAQSFCFQSFNSTFSPQDLVDLHAISLECFEDNYLATPISFDVFKNLYVASSQKSDLSFSFFAYNPKGERVAFFLAFVEHDYIVAKTVAVKKDYRGLGLSNAMMYLTLKLAQERGLNSMVAAMVKEGAQSESYGRRLPLKWTHVYEIIEFSLI